MRRRSVLVLILAAATAVAAPVLEETADTWTVTGDGLAVSVGKTDGMVRIDQLGGVKLGNSKGAAPAFGAPVFTAEQMETAAPPLAWTTSAATADDAVRIVQSSVLEQDVAGLDMAGVKLTRTLVIRAGAPLRLEYRAENPLTERRHAYFGARNDFYVNGNGRDLSYVPTENNVLDFDLSSSYWGYYTRPSPWAYNLVAGWLAVNNGATRQGLGICFDYNMANGAYVGADGHSNGVVVDGGPLPAGSSFTTTLLLIPMTGLTDICHVAPEFCAGITVAGEKVTLGILPGQDGEIAGKMTVIEAAGKQFGELPFTIDGKQGTPAAVSLEIPAPTTQTVAKVDANGQHFEQYRENGFRMAPLPMVPLIVSYHREAPPRQRPDEAADDGPATARGKKALLLFGVYTNFLHIPEILDGWEIVTISAVPQGIKDIPPATTIDEYGMIVLGNVNIECIRGIQPRLAAYVRRGGTLLVCGGPFAYGCGGYTGTMLDGLLPVASRPFDLQPARGEERFNEPVAFAGDGVDAAAPPQLYWLHTLEPQADAQVLLRAGTMPLLVRGAYGKGTVYAFLGAPIGEPKRKSGDRPFWDSPTYIHTMRHILIGGAK